MAAENRNSIHARLARVRPPRVHITYKVEIGDAEPEKELPFVVGVLGDFSGSPMKRMKATDDEVKSGQYKVGDVVPVKLRPLSERKFIQIDRDNFNEIMQRMTPGLQFRVENTLAGDGSEMPVQLTFESLEDFEPARVAAQIKPLAKLLETRTKLRDLLTRVDRSEDLETLLEKILQDPEQLKKLQSDLKG